MPPNTLTAYQSLLVDYTPRPIRTEAQYRRALRRVEKLMKPNLGRAESELVNLMATLIEQYESIEHPTPKIPPADKLAGLIEARELSNAEVARATGIPRSTISEIIAGKRKISTANVARLSKFFSVSPGAFIEAVE